jgi:hypothetical protein
MQFLDAGRSRGARHVVIDPRASATARSAQLYRQPVPGTDLALALGLPGRRFSGYGTVIRTGQRQAVANTGRRPTSCLGEHLRREMAGRDEPRPPALVATAASSGVNGPPAIGAAITGTRRSCRSN